MILDAHWHLICPQAAEHCSKLDSVKADDYAGGVNELTARINKERGQVWQRKMSDPAEQIQDLDSAGIDVAILQPPPIGYYYWTEPSEGAQLAHMVNQNTAEFVAKHPDRFLGWATVPLQDPELAAKEARKAILDLKLSGITMTSNVNGQGLDDRAFDPFWSTVQDLDVPLFIHPGNPPGAERLSNYYLTNFLGFPMDTTLGAVSMVFGGVFDRFPDLKVCLAHAGGVLPFLLGRLEHGQAQRPEAREHCEHPFSYYLKNIFVDTVTFSASTLRYVISMLPPGHVLFGTDYPFDMADMDGVARVKTAVGDDEQLLEQVFYGAMAGLLKLPGAASSGT